MKTTHSEARRMRSQGCSINQIATTLNVSKSSASIWTRDITMSKDAREILTNNSRRSAAAVFSKRNLKCREIRREAREAGRNLDILDPLIATGLALYWGEGNKVSGFTALVNGDAGILKVFVKFLREKMGVVDEKLIIRLTTHSKEQAEIQESFWLNLLNLPKENLRKTTIIQPGKKRTGKCLHGMCRVEVYDVTLIERILGGIESLRFSYCN